MRRSLLALPLLAAAIASCSCPDPIPPGEAADALLAALRDGRFEEATAMLGRDALKRRGGEIGVDIWIESGRLRPRAWTWQAPAYRSAVTQAGPERSSDSWVELEGRVDFAEGTPGRAWLKLEALGCQPNPWRVIDFTMERDPT